MSERWERLVLAGLQMSWLHSGRVCGPGAAWLPLWVEITGGRLREPWPVRLGELGLRLTHSTEGLQDQASLVSPLMRATCLSEPDGPPEMKAIHIVSLFYRRRQ